MKPSPRFALRLRLRALRRKLEEHIGTRGPAIERRLGWPAGRLEEILRADADPKMDDLVLIAEALSLNLGDLFREIETEPQSSHHPEGDDR